MLQAYKWFSPCDPTAIAVHLLLDNEMNGSSSSSIWQDVETGICFNMEIIW